MRTLKIWYWIILYRAFLARILVSLIKYSVKIRLKTPIYAFQLEYSVGGFNIQQDRTKTFEEISSDDITEAGMNSIPNLAKEPLNWTHEEHLNICPRTAGVSFLNT